MISIVDRLKMFFKFRHLPNNSGWYKSLNEINNDSMRVLFERMYLIAKYYKIQEIIDSDCSLSWAINKLNTVVPSLDVILEDSIYIANTKLQRAIKENNVMIV